MATTTRFQKQMKSLADEARQVWENPSLSQKQKADRLNDIEARLTRARGEDDTLKQAQRLMVGGESPASSSAAVFGKSVSGPPALGLDDDALETLHEAVRERKAARVNATVKDATTSGDGLSAESSRQTVSNIIEMVREPTRVLDLITMGSTNAAVVEYIRHESTTGRAGMVAAGGLKPEAVINTKSAEARVRKIAVTTKVNDEDLADFRSFVGYIQNELTRLVIDVENDQLLNGDGQGENLLGLLNQSGMLTRAVAKDETALDALEEAFTDLRTGPAFCAPTSLVLHPSDFSKVRRTKDSQGRYLATSDPTAASSSQVWGVPVLQTTTMPRGTGLVLNRSGAEALVRSSVTIQADYGRDGFEHNQTSFRCEERLAVFSPRPAALLKITGL